MKNKNSEEKKYSLLAKFLSEEMEPSEKEEFLRSTSQSNEFSDLEEMKLKWDKMKNEYQMAEPDAQKAWLKLHEKLKQENLLPNQKKGSKILYSSSLLRMASLALILLAIGAVIFYNRTQAVQPKLISVTTQNSSGAMIKTLADGSVIFLAANTNFSFPEQFDLDKREVKLKGEAFFDIKANASKPFLIETDKAIIQVLGTAFNVKNYAENDFELSVNRGSVKVTLKKENSLTVMVHAGQQVKISKTGVIKEEQISEVTWFKERMVFKDETLRNILEVLNLTRNTYFSVENKDVGNRKITISFENESTAAISELICLALNLKTNENSGSIVFVENSKTSK